jgi:hypothetical protein
VETYVSEVSATPITNFTPGLRVDGAQEDHVALAKELAARSEQQLADVCEPEFLDLTIACAKTSYDVGSLYLFALNSRRRAARTGSAVALMRWSRAVTQARQMVLTDASTESDSKA